MRTPPSRGKIWVMGAAPGSSFSKFPSFCLMAILFYLFSTDRPPSPLIFISRVLQIPLDPSCLERRYWLIIFSHGFLAKRWDVCSRGLQSSQRMSMCLYVCIVITSVGKWLQRRPENHLHPSQSLRPEFQESALLITVHWPNEAMVLWVSIWCVLTHHSEALCSLSCEVLNKSLNVPKSLSSFVK